MVFIFIFLTVCWTRKGCAIAEKVPCIQIGVWVRIQVRVWIWPGLGSRLWPQTWIRTWTLTSTFTLTSNRIRTPTRPWTQTRIQTSTSTWPRPRPGLGSVPERRPQLSSGLRSISRLRCGPGLWSGLQPTPAVYERETFRGGFTVYPLHVLFTVFHVYFFYEVILTFSLVMLLHHKSFFVMKHFKNYALKTLHLC